MYEAPGSGRALQPVCLTHQMQQVTPIEIRGYFV